MAKRGMWPTPRARESGDYTYDQGDKNKPRLTLTGAAKMWPTPSATLGDHGGLVTPEKAREGGTLIEAVSARMWPTPCARDSRTFLGAKRSANSQGGEPLPVAVGGTLNPRWVEWLMGFPDGWTDLGDSATR